MIATSDPWVVMHCITQTLQFQVTFEHHFPGFSFYCMYEVKDLTNLLSYVMKPDYLNVVNYNQLLIQDRLTMLIPSTVSHTTHLLLPCFVDIDK